MDHYELCSSVLDRQLDPNDRARVESLLNSVRDGDELSRDQQTWLYVLKNDHALTPALDVVINCGPLPKRPPMRVNNGN